MGTGKQWLRKEGGNLLSDGFHTMGIYCSHQPVGFWNLESGKSPESLVPNQWCSWGPEDHDLFQLLVSVLGILAFPPGFPVSVSHMPESQETIQAQKGPEHYTEVG